MDSDTSTSSEIKVHYDGDRKRTETTKPSESTDYHFNLLANPNKIVPEAQPNIGDLNPILEESTSKVSETSSVSSKSSRRSSKSSKSSRSSRRSEKKSTHVEIIPEEPRQLSEKEIKLRKIDMLRKLSELKSKGYELSKDYDFNSSLEEMEYEYELLKSFVDKNNGVKMYKQMLINGVALLEFFNEKYDPFDFHLKGWSEHMSVEVDTYDEVMEELYEKYRGTGRNMPPEVKLLLMVTASGAAFHYSKSTLGRAAGLNRPGAVAGMFNQPKEESRFMTPQELHLQKLREQQRMTQNNVPVSNFQANYPAGTSLPPPMPQGNTPRVTINNDVNSILERMKLQNNNNRMVSETTLDSSDMNTSEKKRGRKPKSVIQINT
jgi:hypothetical protein